jgi:small conductance mechanosensitive channel
MFNIHRLYDILYGKLNQWGVALVAALPNFVLALLIIFLFIIGAHYVRKVTVSLVGSISHNLSLIALTGLITSRLFVLLGFFIALGILGLDKTVTSLLAGAGIIGLALGFAFQDLTANLLSGIFITIGQPIRVGDIVETNGFKGRVKEIKIRSTILDNFTGQEIEIPSRRIYENPIVNHSKVGGNQIQIPWKISQKNDLDKVEQLALDTVRSLGIHDTTRPIEVNFTLFDGSNVTFTVNLWLGIGDPLAPSSPHATSSVIKALKKTFEEHEIV